MTASAIPGLVGPGSQPEFDDEKLDYMEMPREMITFARPIAPEPEDIVGMEAGKKRLEELLVALTQVAEDQVQQTLELDDLAPEDLGLVNQILGEGEVSIVCGSAIQAQESVLAGVWRVLHCDDNGKVVRDTIEVGDYPASVRAATFANAVKGYQPETGNWPEGVFNAPHILTEIADRQALYSPGDPVHSINLTLLPQTEADLVWMQKSLGRGNTVILSRGYGNCRISSTATDNVWWVQYFNSQDALILNSLEVIEVPEVAFAAPEDLADSAERLEEIMQVYR